MDLPPRYHSVFDGPAAYQITVQGAIAYGWSKRLEEMAISHITLEDGALLTILTGSVVSEQTDHRPLNRGTRHARHSRSSFGGTTNAAEAGAH